MYGVSFRHASYKPVYVLSNAVVDALENEPSFDNDDTRKHFVKMNHIARPRNTVENLVAFFQPSFSSFSLVRVRGNQIDAYGYAAFTLTVAPYAVMVH